MARPSRCTLFLVLALLLVGAAANADDDVNATSKAHEAAAARGDHVGGEEAHAAAHEDGDEGDDGSADEVHADTEDGDELHADEEHDVISTDVPPPFMSVETGDKEGGDAIHEQEEAPPKRFKGKIAADTIAKVDTNGDGNITHAELKAHFLALRKHGVEAEAAHDSSPEQVAKTAQVMQDVVEQGVAGSEDGTQFTSQDTDNSAGLSFTEMYQHDEHPTDVTPEEKQSLQWEDDMNRKRFGACDANKDGALQFAEYVTAMYKHLPAVDHEFARHFEADIQAELEREVESMAQNALGHDANEDGIISLHEHETDSSHLHDHLFPDYDDTPHDEL